ncbi:pyridoxamine 5'-phosphate oxidase family protein [Paractinoplanes atraurantiacus]|uniref:Pyridoxamine 5'-phosphate oxidase n=1 Tax=Paractinoplanes atraurantiacus TaxID=1036182 RepID=A0A285K8W1_9ACTN|nr:pyridoxamine 5'-phosphate oxidase family protein [Actinoplanes atraurantiacus]SNY69052.1 Pyridoxamine 5'-phosphate oxidase [Actinoplanes atraurantiacus]
MSLAEHARELLESNLYLTLSTVDTDGRPWASPVYFAPVSEREVLWCSEASARHSVNLTGRPGVSFTVFDSTVEPYHGRAVYADAEAAEVSPGDVGEALARYPRRDGHDVTMLDRDDVTAPSEYRLYRASVTALWVLCPREPRTPCEVHGLAKDHRARVF